MKKMYLSVAVLVLTLGAVRSAEPPVLRDVAEPPVLRECACDVCECPVCDGNCTVPILADIPYNASHSCPKCGTFANIVERELAGGVHTHRCGSCSTEWWHKDPGEQYIIAPPRNPFATENCPGGNCPPSLRYSVSGASSSRTYTTTSRSVSNNTRVGPLRRVFGFVFRGRLFGGFR